MAVITGPAYVQNPTPPVVRYGLFTVANGPFDLPAHAADGGIQYLHHACGSASGYEINCLGDQEEKGPFTDQLGATTATPFLVIGGFECATVGLSEQERKRLTFENLIANEQGAVEEIFSEGTFGASPSLANNDPLATDVGTSFGLVEAFSQLEDAFYNTYGFQGVIHLPHAASAYMSNENLATMQNRVWRTAAGTAVSIGNYSGLSPAGVDPTAGMTWIYITPPVTVWRASDSNVFITPLEGALNRETNEVTMFAEREYVVAFDSCPTYATQTLLTEGS